jgi:exopolyphosphatase/guanosine-5'-triphosphate,3'-diphosphate pyrophosphatase
VRAAGIDCGTNTIKLLVADLDPGTGEMVELVRTARMVRLGQGVDASRALHPDALERVLTAVDEYAALLREHDVSRLRFCATSAVRDATNRQVFLDGVRERLGVTPEVLAGSEEARLSYAGATRGLSRALGEVPVPVLVVDIGGGSTELVLGDHDGAHAAHSLDIGSVRLTERFLADDPPTAEQRDALVAAVDEELDTLPVHGVDLSTARTAVAVSGTGLTVAAAVLDLPELDRDLVDRRVVAVADVHEAAQRLAGQSVAERRELPYMHPGRADVIGAGALILGRVLARVPADELVVSVSDILDGITWSAASSSGAS